MEVWTGIVSSDHMIQAFTPVCADALGAAMRPPGRKAYTRQDVPEQLRVTSAVSEAFGEKGIDDRDLSSTARPETA